MTGGCHFCDKQGFGLYFINRIPTRDETGDCLNSAESGSGIASFFSGVLKLGRLIRGNCLSESYPVKSPSGNHQFPMSISLAKSVFILAARSLKEMSPPN